MRVSSPTCRAMPKSVSTTPPWGVTRTFAGLMSRCSTPAAAAVTIASSTRSPMPATRAGGSGPSARMISASDRDGTSSITIHGRPSCSTTSKIVTTAGCRSRAATCASRIVRRRSNWRASSSRDGGSRTSLTATGRSSSRSSARQTVPMPPLARGSTRRYRPDSTNPAPTAALFIGVPLPGRAAVQRWRGEVGAHRGPAPVRPRRRGAAATEDRPRATRVQPDRFGMGSWPA